MNEYRKYVLKYEEIPGIKTELSKGLLAIKICKYVFDNYDFKTFIEFIKVLDSQYIISKILTIVDLEPELQEWFLNNIVNKLNSKQIISAFIQHLNNQLAYENPPLLDTFMKSFIKTGMIKDIELKDGTFYIVMPDEQIIRFTNCLDTESQIKECESKCHSVSKYFLEKYTNDKKLYIATILEEDLYFNTRYHTFLVQNDEVIDFARNMVLKIKNYKKLFEPEIITYIEGDEILKNIEILKEKNKEFNNAKIQEVLKYAIHEQIKNKKRKQKVKKI